MTTELFKELLITEEDVLKQAVALAKDLLGVEESTGRVILRTPRSSLGQRDLVALHLTGQFFAKQMGKVDSASLSLDELSERTGIDSNTVSGRCSELFKLDWVKKTRRGQFEINQYLLNSILEEVASSRRKSELLQPVISAGTEQRSSGGPSSQREKGFPAVAKGKGLTETILSVLGTDWGKTPRDWKEILQALKHNALHYSVGSITGTLTMLTQSGRLRRIKEGRTYKYILP